jgi:hypothetical protein
MYKQLSVFMIACASVFPLLAQSPADTIPLGWRRGGTGTINFSQVSLHNWAAGGQSAVSVLGIANLFWHHKAASSSWTNNLDLAYGLLKTGGDRIRKSDDRFDLLTKYGRNASTDWYYTALLNFRSQLTPTYNEEGDRLISRFLSPGYLLASLGMDYKPNDGFSLFLSPFTGKFTFVADQGLADQGAFGVDPARRNAAGDLVPGTGDNLRREFGAYLNARYRKPIMENITFQTKLDLFSNYLDDPQNVDVNWENLIDLKVNRIISVSIFTHLVYDDDIDILGDTDAAGEQENKAPGCSSRKAWAWDWLLNSKARIRA